MEFFSTAVTSLSTVVTAIGAGVGVWGIINLMEGYGGDNPASNGKGNILFVNWDIYEREVG